MPKKTFFNLSKEKQTRILEISAREFAASPYDVASISEIVRQAGIAKGSFYQYFENKQDLYQTLIQWGTEAKLALVNEHSTPNPKGDLFDVLEKQFLGTVQFQISHPDLAMVLYRAFIQEVPFPEMTEELRRRGTTQFFKQLITQGITHGDVAVWVDPETAAFLLESVFYQFSKHLVQRLAVDGSEISTITIMEDEQAMQILQNLMDLIEAGMKRDPEQRQEYFTKE